jgi:hypothetical protein
VIPYLPPHPATQAAESLAPGEKALAVAALFLLLVLPLVVLVVDEIRDEREEREWEKRLARFKRHLPSES